MERADQVLAVARVDAGLAADRRVDLRQQRRRHLHEIDAAPHHRGGEAREIADHAAAQRNDQVAALDTRREHRVADLLEMREALGALARRHDDRRGAETLQRGLGGGEMMLRHRRVGHDQGFRARTEPGDTFAEAGQQPAADHDVIGALAKPDIHLDRLGRLDCCGGRHEALPPGFDAATMRGCAHKPAMISSTIASCATSRDSTVMSASA